MARNTLLAVIDVSVRRLDIIKLLAPHAATSRVSERGKLPAMAAENSQTENYARLGSEPRNTMGMFFSIATCGLRAHSAFFL